MIMKLIEKLSEYIEEELEDAEKYATCALKYKEDNPMLAKVFYDLSNTELNSHMVALHDEVVRAINDYKNTTGEPPEAMKAVYDYLHEKHIEKANKIKMMHMQYKG